METNKMSTALDYTSTEVLSLVGQEIKIHNLTALY